MEPPHPSAAYTSLWHNTSYAAISPTLPALSTAGKTIIITGAGTGIGRATALAYAKSGCARLVLVGRRLAMLDETARLAKDVSPEVIVVAKSIDLATPDAMPLNELADEIGTWHVLVLNAGYMSAGHEAGLIANAKLEDWWRGFELNLRSPFMFVQAFLPTKAISGAAVIGVSTGAICAPGRAGKSRSSYVVSKLAIVKFLEILACGEPDLFVASVHPGVHETEMTQGAGEDHAQRLPHDDSKALELNLCTIIADAIKVSLPAHFLVWFASPDAAFLKGRFVFANWDVEQLKEKRAEVESGMDLTANVLGLPFTKRVS